MSWIKNTLNNRRELAAGLVFEVAESSMQTKLLTAARFGKLAHALGSKVSIAQFGHGFTSFKFFREVLPDYIKLDCSYSQRIDENGNNRFHIRALVDISRGADIQIVTTVVERQEEKIELEKLLVDGLQEIRPVPKRCRVAVWQCNKPHRDRQRHSRPSALCPLPVRNNGGLRKQICSKVQKPCIYRVVYTPQKTDNTAKPRLNI
ncbi:MAG: EAL domain-containing protein [Shewanella sp.]|nr:EAL domain-containing protein [Shewanella sp.]MCF1456882.1 EAL domain-containing protein [Shewanella sp.]